MNKTMKDEKYTDGFLIPIRKDKLEDYRKAAQECSQIWKEFGALEYVETVIDDDNVKDMRSFASAANTTDDEVVVFAYVVYATKKDRDKANEKIMASPRMKELGEEAAKIFDCSRMAYGGFKTLVRE